MTAGDVLMIKKLTIGVSVILIMVVTLLGKSEKDTTIPIYINEISSAKLKTTREKQNRF